MKMIDRHRDEIIYTAKRTSARRISAPSLENFSGGTTASQAVLTTLQHCVGRSTIISPSTLMETTMRKPRDFDAELKALGDKARDLKSRKVQQLGELVIATGADALSADELAGALIVLAETKEAAKREAWARRAATFFQSRARRIAPTTHRNGDGASAQPGSTQPASSRKGAT
jgi:Conjugal transfer protein TraD